MPFKLALILAFLAQLTAAGLALRLNVRYRIYSAWFFVSAALCVSAILRLITLCQNWIEPPTFDANWVEWASAFAALLSSVLVLAGMSFIEPFFKRMAAAQESLQNERRRLATIVDATEEELRLTHSVFNKDCCRPRCRQCRIWIFLGNQTLLSGQAEIITIF